MSIKHFSSGENAKEKKMAEENRNKQQQEKHATIAIGKKAHS